MKDVLAAILVLIAAIVIIVIICLPIVWIDNWRGENRCHDRFGDGWGYRYSKGPDLCVNANGDVKVP